MSPPDPRASPPDSSPSSPDPHPADPDPDLPAPELHPPAGFTEVAEGLETRGNEAWAVGGAVRDALAGDQRADWDLATDARPAEVRAIFRRTVPLGIEHGTVGVIASDGAMYEVTTFRRDVETDGRHAVVEFAATIDEDLARRDFTINALAWRLATDELRDPFGGREDLRAGVLRAVGDASERFAEDYLRVFRALRFAGRFRLEIDPDTRAALEEAAPRTGRLSAERVREELMKVLAGPNPTDALRLYAAAGVLDVWYPEVVEAAGADPRWEFSLAAVDEISAARPLLRLARWLLPTAPEPGDDDGGLEAMARTEAILARLKFSRADGARVLHLLDNYRPLVGPVDSSAELRRWLAEVGSPHARDLFRLHFALARARGAEESLRALVHTWRRVHAELLEHPPLLVGDLAVDGRDLIALGVDEGPAVGILLDELHARVLEDPDLNERERLEELAHELIQVGHLGQPENPRRSGRREPPP